MLDLGEALPEWLVEIADPELDAQRPRALVRWVEVLVPRHAWRHVDGVPGLPVVVLVVDLGEPNPLQHIQHRLGMGVAVRGRVRDLFEDVGHRDRHRFEAVALVARALAASHQDVDRSMAVRVLFAAPSTPAGMTVALVAAALGVVAVAMTVTALAVRVRRGAA